MNDNNEIQISFRDYLFYTFRRWRGMLLCGVFFALIACSIVFCKYYVFTDNQDDDYEYENELAQYYIDLDTYQQTYGAYEVELNKSKEEMDNQHDYIISSTLLALDPQNTLETSADIVIMLNDSGDTTTSYYDKTDSLLKVFADGIIYKTDWDAIGQIIGREGIFAKELFIVNIDYDSHVIEIIVLYPDEGYANSLLDAVLSQAAQRSDDYSIFGEYSIDILNRTSTYGRSSYVDSAISENDALYTALENRYNGIVSYMNSLEEPIMPVKETLTKKVVIKDMIIYTIIGFLLGILAFFIIHFWRFVKKGIIYSDGEFGRITGLFILGTFARKNKKHIFKLFDKLIDRKDGSIYKPDEADVLERIYINFNSLKGEAKDVIILGDRPEDELSKISDYISKKFDDINFVVGSNFKEKLDSLRRLSEVDSVILVVKREKTMLADLIEEQNTLKTLDKNIIGCVVL